MLVIALATVVLAGLAIAAPARAQSIVIGVPTPSTGPAAVASEWERWGINSVADIVEVK